MRPILFVLLLSGCATRLVDIDYNRAPPPDWPKLEERVTYIEQADLPRYCRNVQEPAARIISCATVSFTYGLCQIYLGTKDPAALEHERGHCKGYGHVGDTVNYQARAWDAFKASKR